MSRFSGVLVPVVTPYDAHLNPDPGRWITFCRGLLAEGAGGLAVFGTTSEANSLSGAERMRLLEQLIAAGVPGDRLLVGAGACSITEAAELVRHAGGCGCGGVLVLPPFYYKAVTDQGIYDFVAAVLDRAGVAVPVYLYHFPRLAGVGYGIDLIDRLCRAFPAVIAGLKDSTGQADHTLALLNSFPNLAIFPGSEAFLLDALRAGAAGCISATANVNLRAIAGLCRDWQASDAAAAQARVLACRRLFESVPTIAALKSVIAARLADPAWRRVRPPLVALDPQDEQRLLAALAAGNFPMLAGWTTDACRSADDRDNA